MTQDELPRRTFLSAAAAALAGTVIGSDRLHAAGMTPARGRKNTEAATDIRLGVASYSLREFPLDKALEMIRALRTPYVNFKSVHVPYDTSPEALKAIRARVEGAGFQIVGGGTITFTEDTDAGVEKYFAYAMAAGMPTIVCTGPVAVLPRVEKFAKQYDIKVAIHNHGTEDKIYPSPYDVLKHVRGMDRRMGLCIDVGHTVRTGTDVVQSILDAGPRLHDMHVKDLADMKSKDSQVAVGEGKLPFPAIFRALKTLEYPGYVNLEYEINARDPLPGMQASFAYMRGVIAGIA
ncbi:MAG: sugar phosphate isomerase/epimerase [Gemmatimonadaceae bacterium]|nr:sugar phosphate isomerase/epimerase [Gemmatimonadaceae bacterium]